MYAECGLEEKVVAKRGKLTVKQVENAKPGMQGDGGGLWLQCRGPNAKSWLFRYVWQGKQKVLGLGPVSTVSLAEARDIAEECRKQVRRGIDPLEARRETEEAKRSEALKATTFNQAIEAFLDAKGSGWRSAKYRRQWKQAIENHVLPVIGDLPVSKIQTEDVLKVLNPLWDSKKVETGNRVRARIEQILDFASVKKWRTSENPARWKLLRHVLPASRKVRPVRHMAAMRSADIPELMDTLLIDKRVPAQALVFTILTCTRTGEVTGARREEIDVENALWTIPVSRLKNAKHPHRVPLTPAALAIVTGMLAEYPDSPYIFPGTNIGRPMGHAAMLKVLQSIVPGMMTHGMRATFMSWCADRGEPLKLANMALGHSVGDAVEQAYQRSDMLERRRRLAEAWVAHCLRSAGGANVVPLRLPSLQPD
jgi:integrase